MTSRRSHTTVSERTFGVFWDEYRQPDLGKPRTDGEDMAASFTDPRQRLIRMEINECAPTPIGRV